MEGRHGENLGFSFQVTTAVRQRSEYFTPSWTAELLRKILKFVYSVYTKKHARIVTPVVVNVLTCTPKFEDCDTDTVPRLRILQDYEICVTSMNVVFKRS